MKKLIIVLISVMLLASCSQIQSDYENVSFSPDAAETDATQTPAPLRTFSLVSTSPSPSPSPTYTFISSSVGEKVSEHFYTGDLEKFFTMPAYDLCDMFGWNNEHSLKNRIYDIYNYGNLGISFLFGPEEADDGFISYGDGQGVVSLQSITLSSFDFRGLNASSSFEYVTDTLGESELLTIRGEDNFESYYYYALRYIIGSFRFEFSSNDAAGAGGLALTITPASESQVFYTSCKKGESISNTLTTGDIKLFFEFTPEDLDSRIGNGYPTDNMDYGSYDIYFEYLGAGIAFVLDTPEDENFRSYPEPPVQFVWINDFNYRGITAASTFKDVKSVLGRANVYSESDADGEYYEIRYIIDGMRFVFSGLDKQASDGVYLCIYPG